MLEVFNSEEAEIAGQSSARHIADQFAVKHHSIVPNDIEDLSAMNNELIENSGANNIDSSDDDRGHRQQPEVCLPSPSFIWITPDDFFKIVGKRARSNFVLIDTAGFISPTKFAA